MNSRPLLIAMVLLAAAPVFAADWTYNMAFTQWAGSNDADRYYTNTPEFCDTRAAEIAAAGYRAVMLSGYHFRLGYLDRDADLRRITAMIVEACHRHDLKVIEHMNLTVHYYDAYPLIFEHPDWLTVHAADMMTRHRIFCPNNPDFQRFYLDYCVRFQRETDIDAWQMDELQWLGRGFCGCQHCRDKWRREKSRPYPAIEAPGFFDRATCMDNPEYREWMHWRGKSLGDFRARIRDELLAIRPDLKLFTYTTSYQSSPYVWTRGSDYEWVMANVDTVGTEINPVPFDGYVNLHALLKCRTALSEASGRAAWAKFDITIPSAYFCWAFGRMERHSLWWSLRPDNEAPRPADLLDWPWQMDDASAATDADVGVLLSKTTRDLRYDFDYFHREFEGWLQALLLEPREVKVLLESQLTAAQLDRLKLLVLPNCSAIAPEQAELLLAWVRGGGRLLMTADTGTLDADGNPAAQPFLSQVGEAIAVEIEAPGDDLPLLTRRDVGAGQVWHLAAKLGPLAFEERQLSSHYRKDGFRPPADPRAVDLIQQVARLALGDLVCFRIEGAPRGLLVGVYRTERDGRPARAIHLLNCTGRDLSEGDPVEFDRDNPPPMPDLPELRIILPGAVSEALLASPELDAPVTLTRATDGGATVLTVPAATFATYGVIWAYD